jgi:Flp pilus assembly pilin Flp
MGRWLGRLLRRVLKDRNGGHVVEYALIAGLIIVAAIAVVTSVGGRVLQRWNSLDTVLDGSARPSAPQRAPAASPFQ